jgi:hypothetical protein
METIQDYLDGTTSFNEFAMKIFEATPYWKDLMESKPLEFARMVNTLEDFYTEVIETTHDTYVPVQPLVGGTTSFIYYYNDKVVVCQTIEDFRMTHGITSDEEITSKMEVLEGKPYETLSEVLYNYLANDFLKFSDTIDLPNIEKVTEYLENEFSDLFSEAYVSFELTL